MPIDTQEEFEDEKLNLSTLHNHIVKIKSPMLYFKSLNLISNDIFETKIEKKYFSNQQLLADTAQYYCNKPGYASSRLRDDLHIISRYTGYQDDANNITTQILNGMIEFINSPENNNPILRFMEMDTDTIYNSLYRGRINEFEFLPNYNKIYEMYETKLYTRYTDRINDITERITEYAEILRLRQEEIELNEDYKIGINNIPPRSIIIFDTIPWRYDLRLSSSQTNKTYRIIKVCNKLVKIYNKVCLCNNHITKEQLEYDMDTYCYRVYMCCLGIEGIIKTEDCCVYKKINDKIELCHLNESDNNYFKSTD